MTILAPGQRVDLDAAALVLSVDSPRGELLAQRTAVLLVALDDAGRRAEALAPADSVTRELRAGAAFNGRHSLSLDLAALPAEVARLSLVLYVTVDAGFTVKELGEVTASAGDRRLRLDLVNRGETAVILFEVYRRGGGWRLAAGGQGFSGGLPAVGRALGIDIPTPTLGPGAAAHPGADPGLGDRRRLSGGRYSGSGVGVASRYVLTNHHVIEDAASVTVASERDSVAAEVVFADPGADIALLLLEREVGEAARFRDPDVLNLGEDVIILGYPLQGLLGSGPQVSSGVVSALCGIRNDTARLQFTAPIASGNSGGPIFDASGLIVGLVCSSLDHEQLRLSGASAENVNFGVKAALLRAFLSAAGVEPTLAPPGTIPSSRADVARQGRRSLHRIVVQC